jgi:hypothetical protein
MQYSHVVLSTIEYHHMLWLSIPLVTGRMVISKSKRLFLKGIFRTRTTRIPLSFTEKSLKKPLFSVFSAESVYEKEGDKDLRNSL